MTLRVWILFLMMETTACLSPGPAVLLVVSQGLSRGLLASTWSSIGILAANALYFALSATGIAAVLLGSKNLFNAITWVGAAYTIWLGVRTFASSGAAVSASAGSPASSAGMFTNGFVLQIFQARPADFLRRSLTAVHSSGHRCGKTGPDPGRHQHHH